MSLKSLEERIKNAAGETRAGYHIFSNENRRRIFRELTRRPCQTVSSVGAELGLDVKVVQWHVSKLMEFDFLKLWERKRRYYYPEELIRGDDMELFRLLNSKDARKILLYAYRGCVETVKIPVSRSTLYRYLRALGEMGLVEQDGFEKKYVCGTRRLKELVETYDMIGMSFKKKFMERVESRGFSVRVVGTVDYELKIEISGLENFTMGIYISPLRTAMEVL